MEITVKKTVRISILYLELNDLFGFRIIRFHISRIHHGNVVRGKWGLIFIFVTGISVLRNDTYAGIKYYIIL